MNRIHYVSTLIVTSSWYAMRMGQHFFSLCNICKLVMLGAIRADNELVLQHWCNSSIHYIVQSIYGKIQPNLKQIPKELNSRFSCVKMFSQCYIKSLLKSRKERLNKNRNYCWCFLITEITKITLYGLQVPRMKFHTQEKTLYLLQFGTNMKSH